MSLRKIIKKPIVAYPAFVNGRKVMAVSLSVESVFDDLFGHVVFKYTLYDDAHRWSGEGAYELRDAEYEAWDSTPEHAYTLVAAGIGVEFTPTIGGSFFGGDA